jgi:hypothetical protein
MPRHLILGRPFDHAAGDFEPGEVTDLRALSVQPAMREWQLFGRSRCQTLSVKLPTKCEEIESMYRIGDHIRAVGLVLVALVVLLARDGRAAPSPRPSAAGKSKGAPAAAVKVEPKLEPKAIALLQAMSQRLAAAHAMTFTALSTEESPTRQGPPLAYTTLSDVTLQRPDKLRVITAGDGPASEFYYDGKTMMAFAPAENLVAVADAPSTIDAALKAAYDSAAIYFPFTDVLVADPYKDIADGLKLAFSIGQSHVVAPAQPARTPTPPASLPAAATPWERSIRPCRPDACTGPSSASTNAGAPGSRPPTGRMASTIGWYRGPDLR